MPPVSGSSEPMPMKPPFPATPPHTHMVPPTAATPTHTSHDARGADALVEQRPAHTRVDGRQRVVQQLHIGAGVGGPSQREPSLLPARQVDAALAQLRGVARGEELEVVGQGAGVDHSGVALGVLVPSKQDVLLHGAGHDPGHLRHVGHAASHLRVPAGLQRLQLAQQHRQQRALARPDLADHPHQPPRGRMQHDVPQRGWLGQAGVVSGVGTGTGAGRSGRRAGTDRCRGVAGWRLPAEAVGFDGGAAVLQPGQDVPVKVQPRHVHGAGWSGGQVAGRRRRLWQGQELRQPAQADAQLGDGLHGADEEVGDVQARQLEQRDGIKHVGHGEHVSRAARGGKRDERRQRRDAVGQAHVHGADAVLAPHVYVLLLSHLVDPGQQRVLPAWKRAGNGMGVGGAGSRQTLSLFPPTTHHTPTRTHHYHCHHSTHRASLRRGCR